MIQLIFKNKYQIVLGLFGILVIFLQYEGYLYRQRAKFTVAHTYKERWSLKSGRYVHYKIFVKGREYLGSADADKFPNIKVKGGRFLAAFDSINPNTNAAFYELSMPDSIKEAPPVGWENPPLVYAQHKALSKLKRYPKWESNK